MTLNHENHPCADTQQCTEASMSRNEETKITIYEFIFPAHSLGIDAYYSGLQFGLSTCINDGDVVGIDGTNQAGQGGWSGWAPYGIVHGGKRAENNGQAMLVGEYTGTGTGDGAKGWSLADWAPTANDPAGTSCATNADGTFKDVNGTTPYPHGSGCTVNDISDWTTEVADMRWEIPAVPTITLDSDLSDWAGVPYMAQTFVEFDLYAVDDADYLGVTDHSVAQAFAWTPAALYYATKVYDDTHQNGNSGWDGDSVQLMFTDAARSESGNNGAGPNNINEGIVTFNYGLHMSDADASGEAGISEHHEFHPCAPGMSCTGTSMTRLYGPQMHTTTVVSWRSSPLHYSKGRG